VNIYKRSKNPVCPYLYKEKKSNTKYLRIPLILQIYQTYHRALLVDMSCSIVLGNCLFVQNYKILLSTEMLGYGF